MVSKKEFVAKEVPANKRDSYSPAILVVAGEDSVSKRLLKLFSDSGYEHMLTASREAALEKLLCCPVDIVLVDIKPSVVEEMDLLVEIREKFSKVAIVVMTGPCPVDDEIESLQIGAEDFLRRPFSDARMMRVINGLLEQRRLRSELEASNQRFEHLVENSKNGIVVINDSGIILFVNHSAERLFKKNRRDLVGEQFGTPLVDGKKAEMDIIRPDGQPGVLEMYAESTEWDGQPGIMVTLIDISKRKELEEELALYSGDLEKMVQERTRDLQAIVNATVGREIRMAELKGAIEKLREQLEKAGITPMTDDPLKQMHQNIKNNTNSETV